MRVATRAIDDALRARTPARLRARLEGGEGVSWQEEIDASVETVWELAAADPAAFFRHLPGVRAVRPVDGGSRPRFTIERELAGIVDIRVGETLVSVERSMFCASDLDAMDVSVAGALPTIYSLSLHEHTTRPTATIVILAGVTLGVYNPWLMQAFAASCRS